MELSYSSPNEISINSILKAHFNQEQEIIYLERSTLSSADFHSPVNFFNIPLSAQHKVLNSFYDKKLITIREVEEVIKFVKNEQCTFSFVHSIEKNSPHTVSLFTNILEITINKTNNNNYTFALKITVEENPQLIYFSNLLENVLAYDYRNYII